jgi:acetyltransferase
MAPGENAGYPGQYEERIRLKDGQEVFLRPVLQSDRDLILDLFHRISPQTLSQRFLTNLHTLPEAMLHHFTHLDYHREFALAGLTREKDRDAIVAVARYAWALGEECADLALTVRDDWQGAGLGTALLERIVNIAGKNGITRFGSMMDTRNTGMEKILANLGYEVRYSLQGAFFQVEILV